MITWCSLVTIIQCCGSWAVLSQSLLAVYVNVKGCSLLWCGGSWCQTFPQARGRMMMGTSPSPLPCWRLAILLWKEQSRDWRSFGQSLTRIYHATWRDLRQIYQMQRCTVDLEWLWTLWHGDIVEKERSIVIYSCEHLQKPLSVWCPRVSWVPWPQTFAFEAQPPAAVHWLLWMEMSSCFVRLAVYCASLSRMRLCWGICRADGKGHVSRTAVSCRV